MVRELIRLAAGMEIRAPDGRARLADGPVRVDLGRLEPGLAAAWERLAGSTEGAGATEAELTEAVTAAQDERALIPLQLLLRRLHTGGWLVRELRSDERPLATLEPLGHTLPALRGRAGARSALVLSRFAHLRAENGELRLETARAPVSLLLHDPGLAATVARLATPAPRAELAPDAEAAALLDLLHAAGFVVPAEEEAQAPLALWSFADLLLHARSRVGRNAGGYGGTYRLRGVVEPAPALKPVSGRTLELPAPDLERRQREDMPLAAVFEQRRSIRRHDDGDPISAAELGEFLYRSARVRQTFRDSLQELSARPYPGGGAVYELELYPLVNCCAGLEPALYRYEPGSHALEHIADPGPPVGLLSEYGRLTAEMETPPQVLIMIAARFRRAMWKYESMAYALVLKDVGVMYQTMYSVATAMGLAPCALGGGPADAFAAAARVDYYEESSVGEFLLGSRVADGG
jgi:SagB-type dehydrogenase family enzyme